MSLGPRQPVGLASEVVLLRDDRDRRGVAAPVERARSVSTFPSAPARISPADGDRALISATIRVPGSRSDATKRGAVGRAPRRRERPPRAAYSPRASRARLSARIRSRTSVMRSCRRRLAERLEGLDRRARVDRGARPLVALRRVRRAPLDDESRPRRSARTASRRGPGSPSRRRAQHRRVRRGVAAGERLDVHRFLREGVGV